jgi:uncharacterized protein involved in response to NO
MLLQIQTPEPARPAVDDGPALWRLGFRPFYLLGAAFAAVGVPLWVVFYAGAARAPAGLPAHLWHSHEMVFGFAVAIIAGFLFTAVRNWTNLPTPRGARTRRPSSSPRPRPRSGRTGSRAGARTARASSA